MFRVTHCADLAKIKFRDDCPVVNVTVYSEIDNDIAEYVQEQVSKAISSKQSFLPVLINSNGGDVYALMSIMETLRAAKKHLEIITVVPGFAASAAVALFCCGDRRYIAPSARLMIHHANLTHYATMSVRELAIESHELKMLNTMMFSQMGDMTVGDPTYYSSLVTKNGDHDLYLSSADAVKHHLATSIGIPEFTTQVLVKRTVVEPDQGDARRQLRLMKVAAKPMSKKKKRKRDVSEADEAH
jgi:ATP-dependent protease ClpP protease subunit